MLGGRTRAVSRSPGQAIAGSSLSLWIFLVHWDGCGLVLPQCHSIARSPVSPNSSKHQKSLYEDLASWRKVLSSYQHHGPTLRETCFLILHLESGLWLKFGLNLSPKNVSMTILHLCTALHKDGETISIWTHIAFLLSPLLMWHQFSLCWLLLWKVFPAEDVSWQSKNATLEGLNLHPELVELRYFNIAFSVQAFR